MVSWFLFFMNLFCGFFFCFVLVFICECFFWKLLGIWVVYVELWVVVMDMLLICCKVFLIVWIMWKIFMIWIIFWWLFVLFGVFSRYVLCLGCVIENCLCGIGGIVILWESLMKMILFLICLVFVYVGFVFLMVLV